MIIVIKRLKVLELTFNKLSMMLILPNKMVNFNQERPI
jgi:hypothetical protein